MSTRLVIVPAEHEVDAESSFAATGPAMRHGCGNAAFVDPDDGHPLVIAATDGFDLHDGYEYLEFNVERAGAVFDVNMRQIVDFCTWGGSDGEAVFTYTRDAEFIALWGDEPHPDDYRAILDWIQPFDGWTGYNPDFGPGTLSVRRVDVDDFFVLVETTLSDGSPLLLGANVDSVDFIAGDGYATAPAVYFEWPLEDNMEPCSLTITGPQDPVRLWRYGTVTMWYVDAPFDDAHTMLIDWGDGTTTVETPEFEHGYGSLEASHKYKDTGLFVVTATVVDSEGQSDWNEFRYVAVYNPKGEDLAGRGRYWSPPGSFSVDPNLSATTLFGFTMRIPKADMVFKATSFDWLVADDGIAYVNGDGELNGVDGYRFRITIEDAAVTGGNRDRIRVQILTEAGSLVYDTQWEDDRIADPVQKVKRGWSSLR